MRHGQPSSAGRSGFGLRRSGFGLRGSGFGLRRSGFGLPRSGCDLPRSGFGLRRLGLVVGLASLAGCLPEAPPPWQVDHTIMAALRIEVVEPGAWAASSPREDRQVAEVMPGDVIRPAPFLIGPDGPVDVEDDPPRYFYCDPTRCLGDVSQPEGVPDCEADEEVPPSRTCELRGGTLALGEMTALLQVSSLFMVAGTPEGPDADTCLRRIRGLDGAAESLQDCILSIQPIGFGPTWRMMLLAAYLGVEDALPLTTITDEVTAAAPNLFPGEPLLRVTVDDPGEATRTIAAQRGETIAARPGATIEVSAVIDPYDAQEYWFVDTLGQFASGYEVVTIGWLFSQAVEWTAPDLLTTRLTAPAQPGPLYLYALVGDGDAITGTWLRFEVAGP